MNGCRQEAQVKQLMYMHKYFHVVWDFKRGTCKSGVRTWPGKHGGSLQVTGDKLNKTYAEGRFYVPRHPAQHRAALALLALATLLTPVVITGCIYDVAIRVPVGLNKAYVPAMWVILTAFVAWLVHVRVFASASYFPLAELDLPPDAGHCRRGYRTACRRPRDHFTPVALRTLLRFLVKGTIEPVRLDLRSSDEQEMGASPGMIPVIWIAWYAATRECVGMFRNNRPLGMRSYLSFAVCIPMFILVTYAVFRWGATYILMGGGAFFMAIPVIVMSAEDMRIVWRHHKNAVHKRHEEELYVLSRFHPCGGGGGWFSLALMACAGFSLPMSLSC